MIDSNAPIGAERVDTLRREATAALGVFFDPHMVDWIASCIVDKVERGVVEDGIPYRTLVGDSGVPSWVAHDGIFGALLVLVSL